jgi:hypothetical protein
MIGRRKQVIGDGLRSRKGGHRTTEVGVTWKSVHGGSNVRAIR